MMGRFWEESPQLQNLKLSQIHLLSNQDCYQIQTTFIKYFTVTHKSCETGLKSSIPDFSVEQ